MARIAKKKTIQKVPFTFSIKESDIIDRENFGAFDVIKTKKGILFKNFTGYHCWFTPYTVGKDGVAHETSTYMWLDNLLATAHATKGHESDPYNGTELTKKDILDADIIITEASLTHPTTAFIDVDKAVQFAQEYMKWLEEKMNELENAMETPVEEETLDDVKKNLEHDTRILNLEAIQNEMRSENK